MYHVVFDTYPVATATYADMLVVSDTQTWSDHCRCSLHQIWFERQIVFACCVNVALVGVSYVEEPSCRAPEFRSFASNILPQTPQNVMIVLCINSLTLANKFMVNDSVNVKENHQHALGCPLQTQLLSLVMIINMKFGSFTACLCRSFRTLTRFPLLRGSQELINAHQFVGNRKEKSRKLLIQPDPLIGVLCAGRTNANHGQFHYVWYWQKRPYFRCGHRNLCPCLRFG